MLKIETRRLKIGLTPPPNPVQPVHVWGVPEARDFIKKIVQKAMET